MTDLTTSQNQNGSVSGEGSRALSRGRGTRSSEPLSGAPPSNTAPYRDIGAQILRSGVDSIYYSFAGEMRDGLEDQIAELKQNAQGVDPEARASANLLLADHPFAVMPKGRGRFPYVIRDNWYHISLSGAQSRSLPMAYVQVSSELLTRAGLDAATGTLNVLMEMISGKLAEPSISRVDLCVDFVLNEDMGRFPSDHFVFLANNMTLYHIHGELTGYQFGERGRLNARLYDKTLEAKKSNKEYLYPIWTENGWDGRSKVWRIEFELRKEFLNDLGIKTRNDLKAQMESIWQYCTTTWLQVKHPTGKDMLTSRWLVYPWWAEIQDATFSGSGNEPIERVKKHSSPSDEYLFVNGLGAITTYMAINSITDVNEGIRQYFEAAREYHCGRVGNLKNSFEVYMLDKVHAKQAAMSVRQTWQEHAVLSGERHEQ